MYQTSTVTEPQECQLLTGKSSGGDKKQWELWPSPYTYPFTKEPETTSLKEDVTQEVQ